MKEEIKGKVRSDSYVCNAGWWTTDYSLEEEGNEDLQDLLKKYDGKRVRVTIEEI